MSMTWRPRLTFRTRLTLIFTALLALAGALIVLIVAVFMRTVPSYSNVPVDSMSVTKVAAGAETTTINADVARATSASFVLRSSSDILDANLLVSVLVLVAVVAVGALIAWLVAGRVLRPLQEVNAAAKLAGTGAFDHRIGLGGPRDEVRELADTFDDMLERLDRSFAASQRFAANASHELQTPLATTQTMLEVTLADPDADPTQLRAVAARVLEMNRRSIETVGALLDLAEIEEREWDLGIVDLVPLVRACINEEASAIAAAGLQVHDDELPDTALVRGDAVLLRQAVGNLVRNAVWHNRPGGELHIQLETADEATSLVVQNSGSELSDELVASLTEPFVRGAGRTSGTGPRGHGLGLAIVDSVVRAHHGALDLRPRPGGGLVVTFTLTRASATGTPDPVAPDLRLVGVVDPG